MILFYPFWSRGEVFIPGDVYNFIFPWKKELLTPPERVHNLEIFDVAVFFYPQDVFYNQELHAGRLPLWNPHIFNGHPLFASGQSAYLYPPRLLMHALLAPALAKTLLLVLHVPLIGLGFFLWLRGRQFSPQASCLGAVAFMLNAQVTSWLEFEHVPLMSAWLGFQLYCIDRACEGRKWLWTGLILAWAAQISAGHLQPALYLSLQVGVYALFRILSSPGEKGVQLRELALSLVMVALISAPVTVPFVELLRQSQRQPLDLATLGKTTATLPSLLLTLLCPDAFGNPTHHFLLNRCTSNFVYPEFANFVGFVPWVLALSTLAAVRRHPQRRELQFCWLMVGVAVLMASAQLPYIALVTLVPPLKLFLPGRALLLIPMPLAFLAAWAWDRQESLRRSLLMSLGICFACWCLWLSRVAVYASPQGFAAWWTSANQSHEIKIPPPDIPVGHAYQLFLQSSFYNPQCYLPLVLGGALGLALWRRRFGWGLVALASVDLLLFAGRFNTTVSVASLFPLTPSLQIMQRAVAGETPGTVRCERWQSAVYNTATPYGFSFAGGYESLYPRRTYEVSRVIEGGPPSMRFLSFKRYDSPLLDAWAVKYLIASPLEPDLATPGSRWEALYRGESTVYRNRRALGRAFWVERARSSRSLAESCQIMAESDFDPASEVVLEGADEKGPLPRPSSSHSPHAAAVEGLGRSREEGATVTRTGTSTSDAQIEWKESHPNQVTLKCTARSSGYLVLSDTFYPGWTCKVDGAEQAILIANGCSRAVALGSGSHLVEMSFRPPSFRWAAGFACAAAALTVAVGFWTGTRRASSDIRRAEPP